MTDPELQYINASNLIFVKKAIEALGSIFSPGNVELERMTKYLRDYEQKLKGGGRNESYQGMEKTQVQQSGHSQ